MIRIKHFVFNLFQENTYVLYDETRECVIIDPGCYQATEQKQLLDFIRAENLTPVKLLNTHCHIDHVLGNRFVADTFGIPLYMHEGELFTYNDLSRWAMMFDLKTEDKPENRIYVTEKDTIRFGNSSLQISFVPGHSIAHIVFYHPEEKLAIVGDTLFRQGIGRTDLPGGDYETLMTSIRSQMMIWDDDMRLFPGHGPDTTIGYERKNNPFLTR